MRSRQGRIIGAASDMPMPCRLRSDGHQTRIGFVDGRHVVNPADDIQMEATMTEVRFPERLPTRHQAEPTTPRRITVFQPAMTMLRWEPLPIGGPPQRA